MTKRVVRVPTHHPWSPRGLALADSLETHFQSVINPSVTAVIEKDDVSLRYYFFTSANETHLTTPDGVHEAINGFKVRKALCPNGIPDRAFKHLSKRAVSFLAHIFKAFLRAHHFPQKWKHAREISNFKLVKDPALPSSYRPISLLDKICNLFKKRSY